MVDRDKSSWIKWKMESKYLRLTPSLRETLDLFLNGNDLEKISKVKGVNMETVERYIIELISKSLIDVNDVLDSYKVEEILNGINNENIVSLKEIYNFFGEGYSYFEIKCVLAKLSAEPEHIK
ncbi:MAG: helix-turn-helix domain-containing protein [Nanoarchaeota archaeon]|nr:helix-turn-helix domain-containing protein [Nanoarchaeota archaeon]